MIRKSINEKSELRRKIQQITWVVVPLTIIGGLIFPHLGFIVLLVMLMGLVGGIVMRGRFVCGWLCPRGAFYDRIMSKVSPKKKIPLWLRDRYFRWTVFVILMGFMGFQLAAGIDDPAHWGRVFIRICLLTTSLGIILALFIHPRTWCSFCPMGTVQSAFSTSKSRVKMADGCKKCRTCEKSCPMDLEIVGNIKNNREIDSLDCLKCPECQINCPKGVLHF